MNDPKALRSFGGCAKVHWTRQQACEWMLGSYRGRRRKEKYDKVQSSLGNSPRVVFGVAPVAGVASCTYTKFHICRHCVGAPVQHQ